jgi:hypothetical protein
VSTTRTGKRFNRAPHPRISSQTDRARRRTWSAPAPLQSQDERIPTGGGRVKKSHDAARAADGRNLCAQLRRAMRPMQQKFRQAPLPKRSASQRCVEPACHTSTASWVNWCQCWSRDRRRVASSCGCVAAGVNRGANVRRTSATGECENAVAVIARSVAFVFGSTYGIAPISKKTCTK